MDYLIKIINDSITGIIYFAALFFFILRYIKVDDLHLRRMIKDNKDLMLYFMVLIVFISRIIGGMAESIMSAKMMDLISPDITKKICPSPSIFQGTSKTIPISQNLIDLKEKIYLSLVFYRHLGFSTFLFGISLIVWYKEKS